MAVEATHLNPFSPQPTQDRDMWNPLNQGYAAAAYNSHHIHFLRNSFATALPEKQSTFYPPTVCGTVPANADTGLTNNIPASRKRSREQLQKNNTLPPFPSLIAAGDTLPQIQQFQLDIDALISDHTKKIRLELEERQKQQEVLLAGAIGESMIKKFKEKDDHIRRMGKLNLVLQEKVKSLYVENQLLRDLAQTNEAAANSLRTNLEQVLLHVGGEEHFPDGAGGAAALEEEVGSCCGSIDDDGGRGAEAEDVGRGCYGDRRCRKCGERESCVLLLPCRHLCLCNVCGTGSQQVHACPVCHSTMTATLHVNLST